MRQIMGRIIQFSGPAVEAEGAADFSSSQENLGSSPFLEVKLKAI
jgi:hypothetical protein